MLAGATLAYTVRWGPSIVMKDLSTCALLTLALRLKSICNRPVQVAAPQGNTVAWDFGG